MVKLTQGYATSSVNLLTTGTVFLKQPKQIFQICPKRCPLILTWSQTHVVANESYTFDPSNTEPLILIFIQILNFSNRPVSNWMIKGSYCSSVKEDQCHLFRTLPFSRLLEYGRFCYVLCHIMTSFIAWYGMMNCFSRKRSCLNNLVILDINTVKCNKENCQ